MKLLTSLFVRCQLQRILPNNTFKMVERIQAGAVRLRLRPCLSQPLLCRVEIGGAEGSRTSDNGIQFTLRAEDIHDSGHIFGRVCAENGIEHRLTRIGHPWTNGQVERMNRTIKDATVKRFHYDSHSQLDAHLDDFVKAYNFPRSLKTLGGLTHDEFICYA